MSAWADVAVLTGTKTLDGRLVVRPAAGLPFLLSDGMTVHFVPPQTDVPRSAVITDSAQGAGGDYIVRFDTISDKTLAGRLIGCHLIVRASDLEGIAARLAEDSLVGYQVDDEALGFVGTVREVQEMPAQFLLVVDRGPEQACCYIPFVDAFVLEIDDEARVIYVDLPDGLLDL